MTLTKTDYPCWLPQHRLNQAKALQELGFTYCGDMNDFSLGYKLATVDGWEFWSAEGEVAIDAVYDGALYSLCLEIDDNQDCEVEFKKAKEAIRRSKKQEDLSCKQMSLFQGEI
jgi:hypothetical protein